MYDKERALRTDTDSNDTVKISPIPICGICIGASLVPAAVESDEPIDHFQQ